MDAEFWHSRWRDNQIRFHQHAPNGLMAAHFDAICGQPGARVFVPLCGKTLDIGWLLERGYRVAGAELSSLAVDQLFDELGLTPQKTELGGLTHYQADRIDIFAGDIFDLTGETLGAVDMIYDRAAFVALPDAMRSRYAAHMVRITDRAPQFLIALEYDQSAVVGPPFACPEGEVRRCYGSDYDTVRMTQVDVEGGLKGKCPATANLWRLAPL